jgi:hypothetical protein
MKIQIVGEDSYSHHTPEIQIVGEDLVSSRRYYGLITTGVYKIRPYRYII